MVVKTSGVRFNFIMVIKFECFYYFVLERKIEGRKKFLLVSMLFFIRFVVKMSFVMVFRILLDFIGGNYASKQKSDSVCVGCSGVFIANWFVWGSCFGESVPARLGLCSSRLVSPGDRD